MFAKERHASNLVRAEFVGKRFGEWQVARCIKRINCLWRTRRYGIGEMVLVHRPEQSALTSRVAKDRKSRSEHDEDGDADA